MTQQERLFKVMQCLRGGEIHRAQDIASQMKVSVRTIYRDIDKLVQSGVPIIGSRGTGYQSFDLTTLPPLSLTSSELEALNLGIAIVMETADPQLRAAAKDLANKVDANLSEKGIETEQAWRFASSPFSDNARGFSLMPLIRAAIKAKQKLKITYNSAENRITSRTVRPLEIEYWGRVWTLTAWCEARSAFRVFRVDLVQSVEALPEMFVDEDGKRLRDYVA